MNRATNMNNNNSATAAMAAAAQPSNVSRHARKRRRKIAHIFEWFVSKVTIIIIFNVCLASSSSSSSFPLDTFRFYVSMQEEGARGRPRQGGRERMIGKGWKIVLCAWWFRASHQQSNTKTLNSDKLGKHNWNIISIGFGDRGNEKEALATSSSISIRSSRTTMCKCILVMISSAF